MDKNIVSILKDAGWCSTGRWMYPYHRIHQSHADFLMLDVGIIQSDGDFHLIKYAKAVMLNFQSGALKGTHAGDP